LHTEHYIFLTFRRRAILSTNENDTIYERERYFLYFYFLVCSESNIWQIAAVKGNDIIACRNSQGTSVTREIRKRAPREL